jgi:hypothetical protein
MRLSALIISIISIISIIGKNMRQKNRRSYFSVHRYSLSDASGKSNDVQGSTFEVAFSSISLHFNSSSFNSSSRRETVRNNSFKPWPVTAEIA